MPALQVQALGAVRCVSVPSVDRVRKMTPRRRTAPPSAISSAASAIWVDLNPARSGRGLAAGRTSVPLRRFRRIWRAVRAFAFIVFPFVVVFSFRVHDVASPVYSWLQRKRPLRRGAVGSYGRHPLDDTPARSTSVSHPAVSWEIDTVTTWGYLTMNARAASSASVAVPNLPGIRPFLPVSVVQRAVILIVSPSSLSSLSEYTTWRALSSPVR